MVTSLATPSSTVARVEGGERAVELAEQLGVRSHLGLRADLLVVGVVAAGGAEEDLAAQARAPRAPRSAARSCGAGGRGRCPGTPSAGRRGRPGRRRAGGPGRGRAGRRRGSPAGRGCRSSAPSAAGWRSTADGSTRCRRSTSPGRCCRRARPGTGSPRCRPGRCCCRRATSTSRPAALPFSAVQEVGDAAAPAGARRLVGERGLPVHRLVAVREELRRQRGRAGEVLGAGDRRHQRADVGDEGEPLLVEQAVQVGQRSGGAPTAGRRLPRAA